MSRKTAETTRLQEKDAEITRLQERLVDLSEDYSALVSDYQSKCNQLYAARREPVKQKAKYAASLCFDFWPLEDWRRLSFSAWNPGRYMQLTVGPIRLDFFET